MDITFVEYSVNKSADPSEDGLELHESIEWDITILDGYIKVVSG